MISDFIDSSSYEKPMKILNSKHDLVAIRVLDETETEFPVMPELELEDSETGRTISFDASSSELRKAFAKASDAERNAENDSFKRAEVDLIDLRCSDDIVKPLMAFFRSRK